MPLRSPRGRPRQVLSLFAAIGALALSVGGTLRAAGSGTTQQDAGLSCKALLAGGLSTGDGVYWIDPTGGDRADAFQAYCDMTSNTGVPGIDRGHPRDLTNLAIDHAPTTTALSASSTAVAALQPFTLTATVGAVAPGAGGPTGTVTFFDGAMRVGTATSSGGVATLTMTGHIPGAHAFTARYDGGGNFAASTSAPAGVTVRDLAQSTLTFAYPINGQQFFGLRVTLGAMVIALAGGVTPTGSVAFFDGGTLLGTAPLSAGVAHLSTNALPVGARLIYSVYLGNATWAPSVSSPAAYNVFTGTTPLTVPMTLTSPVAPTPLGDPMAFHVAFVPLPGNETPTGTVVFLADNTLLGTAPISKFDGLARAELTTSALSAGVHLISAVYVGDAVFGAIAAGPILREVR
jgi:hypothetical protein